jgi:hypothetical protein
VRGGKPVEADIPSPSLRVTCVMRRDLRLPWSPSARFLL